MIPVLRALIAAVILSGGLAAPGPAFAACGICGCSVSTAGLALGNYDPSGSAPTTANAQVAVSCLAVLTFSGNIDIALSGGTSTAPLARQMANGTARLSYNVYQDSAYTTVWGTGGANGSVQTLSFSSVLAYSNTLTAYGRIPTKQWVKPGAYTDALVVTVTF